MQCLHTETSLAGRADEYGDLYIGKSVILRFVLDVQESGSSNKSVNLQSNYDAHGYVIYVSLIAASYYWLIAIVVVYLHTCVGFGVARSYLLGDARASRCGTSDR